MNMETTNETGNTVLRLEEASKLNVKCTFKPQYKNKRNLCIKYLVQIVFSVVILNRIYSYSILILVCLGDL